MDPLTWLVLNATADDWESITQIQKHVAEQLEDYPELELATTIKKLVEDGLIKVMNGTEFEPSNLLERPTEYWFGMTIPGIYWGVVSVSSAHATRSAEEQGMIGRSYYVTVSLSGNPLSQAGARG